MGGAEIVGDLMRMRSDPKKNKGVSLVAFAENAQIEKEKV